MCSSDHEKPVSWYMMIFNNLKNPFVLILIVLGTVSYLTGDLRATIVVFVMIDNEIVPLNLESDTRPFLTERRVQRRHTIATSLYFGHYVGK